MREIDGKKVKLFSLSSNVPLAKEIAKTSDIPLSVVDVLKFADGEISVNIEESVRGCHIFVIQSTSSPANEHYMELFIMIDALKRASAASINIIMPYYGYSRQDRKSRSREPITAKLVADMIQSAGANRVVSIDLHAGQIQGFFDIPIDNFPAAPLLATYFKNISKENLIVVSPDHGGTTRARSFARLFGVPIAIIDKRRPEPNKAEVMNVIGKVRGKTCILVDDIIDTAGTIIAGAQALKEAGANKVYACATHGVLSFEAVKKLSNSCIEKIVITNTIKHDKLKDNNKFEILSIGHLLGKSVLNIVKDEPISQIFNDIYKDPLKL